MEGENDDGDPAAAESIIEPSDDVRELAVLDADIPGRSWRGREAPLVEINAGEAAATGDVEQRTDASPGDFF
jgi:hypothetical protein